MADQHTVKVIEQCQVSPPPASVPSTTLPLSFLDIPWCICHPIQRIFFYDFPCSTHRFLQTALPTLKHSLSLTLQYFFPFAGHLIFPPPPLIPHIHYTDGNSVPLTVAESTADFAHLVADSPQDVRNWHPFVPIFPPPLTSEAGTRLIPLMAIQITVLSNAGFSICVSFNHVAADGRAFHHFMKFWASVCKNRGDFTRLEHTLPLPFHNRDIIEDPKGIKLIHLEELRKWKLPWEKEVDVGVFNDKVRATFVLSRDKVDKLKKWVSAKCTSDGSSGASHISTFVVTSSLIWVCIVKSEEATKDIKALNNELYNLSILADCSNLSGLSVPSTYFGNCLVSRLLGLKRRELVGENGIIEAVKAIESRVRDIKKDALREAERMLSDYMELLTSGQPFSGVAGSPKLGVYETDFGWGQPKKSEAVHIDFSGSFSLSDSRDKEGGIEVGLALGRIQMNNFAAILEEQLRNVVDCD